MAINTAERRRSALDFGKGPRGTGMHIPSGSIKVGARLHIVNLYGGIPPTAVSPFFWRHRGIIQTIWQGKTTLVHSSTQEP